MSEVRRGGYSYTDTYVESVEWQRDKAYARAEAAEAEVERLRAAEENREKAIRAAWDDESRVGIEAIVAWVRKGREECAKKGGIFDTIFRCESDGGEWFLFDPETLTDALAERDRLAEALREAPHNELCASRERLNSYYADHPRPACDCWKAAALKREEGK